jgi:hypothetical protein
MAQDLAIDLFSEVANGVVFRGATAGDTFVLVISSNVHTVEADVETVAFITRLRNVFTNSEREIVLVCKFLQRHFRNELAFDVHVSTPVL